MYKNTLQEFCQKHSYPLPSYETTKCGGPSHQPTFKTSVTMTYKEIIHKIYGKAKPTKKKAEISAAKEMIFLIDTIVEEETDCHKSDNQVYILIDMENIHMGNFFHQRKFSSDFQFIGFATTNHPSIKAAPSALSNIETFASDRKDACDIMIIGYATRLVLEGSGDIIIVTKDHFGQGLVDYINHLNPAIKCRCIKTIESLSDYFKLFVTVE